MRGATVSESSGQQLYSAVERIVEGPDAIMARLEAFEEEMEDRYFDAGDSEIFFRTSERLIDHFSKKTMFAGGMSAVPSIFPGIGTALALVPGSLADMTFCLKFEVELVLSLSALYGFDIYDDHERSLAFLIASVSTYEVMEEDPGALKKAGRVMSDLASVEKQAIWNYSPRQVGKLMAKVFAYLALRAASKYLLKAVPFVGIGIAAVGNRVLTRRVGTSAKESLRYRVASGG